MGSWSDVLEKLNNGECTPDDLRQRYIQAIASHTDRNVLCYYSGWLQKDAPSRYTSITDDDMNGFMNAAYRMDRSKGVDLVLHTPGGEIAATEAIVRYLRSCFTDIRAVVPQLAMSAGTMIACACNEVIMGRESSLGPTGPQLRGVAAGGVIEEFDRAVNEVKAFPQLAPLWQTIIGQYGPTFLGDCEKAIDASRRMISEWLRNYMFPYDPNAPVDNIVSTLCDHSTYAMHARHLSYETVRDLGMRVAALEDDQELQDLVLSLHHAYMCTFSMTRAIKIIEGSVNPPWISALNVSG